MDAVVLVHVVNRYDVRMVQLRGRASLTVKPMTGAAITRNYPMKPGVKGEAAAEGGDAEAGKHR